MERPLWSICALAVLLATSGGCAGPLSSTPRVSPAVLRSNTVSVHVAAPEKVAALFRGIADRMQQKGKPEMATFFAQQTGGSFGSGFLVRRNGELLVVTNRHVVDFADEAEISLDGSDRSYSVDVIYTDAVYDLAVLAFREPTALTGEGLRLAAGSVHDLETVVATGFPDLDGRPSYQATRGQVSNERFEAVSRGQRIQLVQHTAPIDPGSSGGPLTSDTGAVVGVNSIKYAGRDNVYLAIPAYAVTKVVDRAVETKRGRRSVQWLTHRLADACGRLVSGLRQTDEPSIDVYDLITNDVIAEKGFESMDAMARANKDLWTLFVENPTTLMRIAVSMRLWTEAHKQHGLPITCLPLEQLPETSSVRLLMQSERGTRETYWRFEQGAWKLSGFERVHVKSPALTSAPKPKMKATPTSKPTPKPKPKPPSTH